jgi:hypothetical protein
MAIATYADLETAVLDELDRAGDTAMPARVVKWAQQTTARANRLLRTQDGFCIKTGTISPDADALAADGIQALATNYNGMTEARLLKSDGTRKPLIFQDHLMIADEASDDATGEPTYYSIIGVGGSISAKFSPVPDGEYTVEFWTFEKLSELEGDSDTNWLLTNHPDAYVTWCSYQGWRFLGEPTTAQAYADDFYKIIGEIRTSDAFNASGQRRESPYYF